MPAALDVNWNEIRMLACDVGMKEASDRTGISYEAIRQRASREEWFANIPRNQPLPPTKLQPVTYVTLPHIAQAQSMLEDSLATRSSYLRKARAVAHEIEQVPTAALLVPEMAQMMHTHVKSAAVVCGWNADSRPDAPGKGFGSRRESLVIDAELVQEMDSANVPHADNGQNQPGESTELT